MIPTDTASSESGASAHIIRMAMGSSDHMLVLTLMSRRFPGPWFNFGNERKCQCMPMVMLPRLLLRREMIVFAKLPLEKKGQPNSDTFSPNEQCEK